MHSSIEECLEVYKDELKKYLKWVNEKRDIYAGMFGVRSEQVHIQNDFAEEDYKEYMARLSRLRAMKKVLGIKNTEED